MRRAGTAAGRGRAGLLFALLLAVLAAAQPAPGLPRPGDPAPLLYFPLVEVAAGRDTELRLANTASRPVTVLCFYVNTNRHCSTTGAVCGSSTECCDGNGQCGLCLPGWRQTDFRIPMTPGQPLGWLAREGRRALPLDGVHRIGPDGSSNAGGRIPPVPEIPFRGALLCAALDDDGRPLADRGLTGAATILDGAAPALDSAAFSALGLPLREGGPTLRDRIVIAGGPAADVEGCAATVAFDHWFDEARPLGPMGAPVRSELILLSCSADLARAQGGAAVVQFVVTNEFEQRFSTSRPMFGHVVWPLSHIDTPDAQRSVFSAAVAGTVAGQTRLRAVGNGVLAVVREVWHGGVRRAAVHHAAGIGQHEPADLLLFP